MRPVDVSEPVCGVKEGYCKRKGDLGRLGCSNPAQPKERESSGWAPHQTGGISPWHILLEGVALWAQGPELRCVILTSRPELRLSAKVSHTGTDLPC